jgi:single-strand DNA-binding protein
MFNYTAATIEGNVTHEPVMRSTKTGKAVCTFSVAVNHFSSPDSQPRVSFVDIETWEKVAEICSKRIAKGKKVLIIGTLKQDRWEGKDGKTQSKIKLVGKEIRFLDTHKEEKVN